MASIEEQFEEAQIKLKTLTERPSNPELLNIYGLFKQATEGDNETKKPGMFDMKGQFKWQSWKDKEGTSVQDACQGYIDLVKELLETYSHS
jgi:diazepam-binding inhibitor (GABA receptor modulating acyl-CoA-binding protein)